MRALGAHQCSRENIRPGSLLPTSNVRCLGITRRTSAAHAILPPTSTELTNLNPPVWFDCTTQLQNLSNGEQLLPSTSCCASLITPVDVRLVRLGSPWYRSPNLWLSIHHTCYEIFSEARKAKHRIAIISMHCSPWQYISFGRHIRRLQHGTSCHGGFVRHTHRST